MSTKVLNKLVNICSTLSGDEVSTGTSSSGTSSSSECLTKDEIIDLIYPVGCVLTLKSSSDILSSTPSSVYGGTWQMLDSLTITPALGDEVSCMRWLRTA